MWKVSFTYQSSLFFFTIILEILLVVCFFFGALVCEFKPAVKLQCLQGCLCVITNLQVL